MLALLAAAAAPNSAFAQANVDVNITMGNGITILYYYSVLDITLSTTTIGSLLTADCTSFTTGGATPTQAFYCNRGNGGANTVTATAGTVTAAFTAPTSAAGSVNLAAVPLVLSNVWAVRAVGGGAATTTVQITRGADTVLNNGASATIGINNNVGIATGATAALTGASPQATTFTDPGLATALSGSVALSLDLSNASATGVYSSTSGNVNYVLTVTGT
jgi:hypothetical protein